MSERAMAFVVAQLNRIDRAIAGWMARHGIRLLRISLGVVFLWFGVLKFFPSLSPAAIIAGRTVEKLTFGLIGANAGVMILAAWETAIGLGLVTGIALRATLALLFVQMLGTITPLFLFPGLMFTRVPYAPTMEGQYIIKNLVLVAAGIVIGATVRGGAIVPDNREMSDTLPRPRRTLT
jgi:uncharacterized membrane protein YkgB